MKKILFICIQLILIFPLVSKAADPTVQASNLTITNRTSTTLTATWNRGNGNRCLVVCRPVSSSTVLPVDGLNNYAADANYGDGADLGSSNFVVYNGTSNSITVTGLSSSTNYRILVYEFNFTCNPFCFYYYLTTTSTQNSQSAYTLCGGSITGANIVNVNAIGYTTASCNLDVAIWTSVTILTMENYSNGGIYYQPVDGTSYTANASYQSGSLIGGDTYAMFGGSVTNAGVTVNLSNLLPATTYRLRTFGYCGSSTGDTWDYGSNAATYNFTTLNHNPTINNISAQTACIDGGQYSVSLSNITSGDPLENQNLSISATSNNTTLIPNANISIVYTSPNNTATLLYTPASGQSGTATISVTVNDGFSSNNTTTKSFTVTVNPYPNTASAISGTTTVCKNGTNYVYSINSISNATSYEWTFPNNTVIVSGGSSNVVTVNFPPSVSQSTYTIKARGVNTCGDGISSSLTLNFDALPTISNAGSDQVICSGTTQLQGNLPSVGSGLWSVNSGSASFNLATQNNTNVTGIASGQTVLLDWTISNGVCPASVDQVSIEYDPSATQCLIFADFFASNTSPCVNAGVNFSDNSVGATGWTWNFGANASPTSSNLQNPTGVIFTSAGPQSITLTVTGPNGTDGETKSNYINVIPVPGAASAISGDATVCEGQTQVLYSINNLPNATDYLWTLPNNATINSGTNTESISVDYNLGSTSGVLSVQGSNSCGVGAISNLNITVDPLPSPPGAITGSALVCQGETGLTYSIDPITNASSYVWTVPVGATITQNNGTSIVVDYSNSAVTGGVTVYGVNSCGEGDIRQLTVVVNPLPGSVVSIDGPINISNCPISTNIEYAIDSVANATSYSWSMPIGASITSGFNTDTVLMDFSFGALSGDIIVTPENACGTGTSGVLSIFVDPTVAQEYCLATVDNNSDFNTLVWEKDGNPLISHYNIYREVTTNNYNLIGTVDVDSLSQYNDSVADPNVTSYKYKITAVDTCGNESLKSNYHSTIHLQFLGNGNLQWTLYEIENQSNPVDFYEVFRDDSSNGTWNSISNTIPGGNSTFTDVNYALYPNPSYRVDVIWATTCTSGRAGVNTSRSNIKNAPATTVGLNEELILNNIKLFPNPAHSSVQIAGVNGNYQLTIFNNIGQVVVNDNKSDSSPIDISSLPNGVYSFKVVWEDHIKIMKFIKN